LATYGEETDQQVIKRKRRYLTALPLFLTFISIKVFN